MVSLWFRGRDRSRESGGLRETRVETISGKQSDFESISRDCRQGFLMIEIQCEKERGEDSRRIAGFGLSNCKHGLRSSTPQRLRS